jgi:N-acetylmuramoyl-L-alanine amidase
MKICINAGHTKLGKGTGANGLLNESIETRKIAYELMKLLANTNHEVVPVVFDKSSNNLKEIVLLSNEEQADLFVSIHLNAGGGTGAEAFTYKGAKHQEAINTLKNLEKLGFKNRGVKDGTQFYVVKNTTMKAILIEICFVDNKKDVELYNKVGVERIAKAIFDAIK